MIWLFDGRPGLRGGGNVVSGRSSGRDGRGGGVRVYTGNDVVDLVLAREREPLEPDWIRRHLTDAEMAGLPPSAPASSAAFWSLFAAKEAACKAFAQAGVETPGGAFRMLEVDLEQARVRHLASGDEAELLGSGGADGEYVHAVALIRREPAEEAESGEGGPGGKGETAEPETVFSGVARLPDGADPSDYARERLLASIAKRLAGRCADGLAIGTRDGIPAVLRHGAWQEWSVSLSHSGRLVAWSWAAVLPAADGTGDGAGGERESTFGASEEMRPS